MDEHVSRVHPTVWLQFDFGFSSLEVRVRADVVFRTNVVPLSITGLADRISSVVAEVAVAVASVRI